MGDGMRHVAVMTSYGDGVYKSTDAGKDLKKKLRPLEKTQHYFQNSDSTQTGIPMLVLCCRLKRATSMLPTLIEEVYKSTDGGATWEKVLFRRWESEQSNYSMRHETTPEVLYASTEGSA